MTKPAILFIIFNRPDTTQQVFQAIRSARPSRLYIAADGYRTNKTGEQQVCEETRSVIKQIDWDCELQTLFQDKNLGCKNGVSTAINWFFSHEQEGIILEDDVVPHSSFFTFCGTMLERYRNNESIMMITGFNPLGANINNDDYFFSRIPNIWGWATWASRWKQFDISMQFWPSIETESYLNQFMPNRLVNSYKTAFNRVKSGDLDTWDYQWTFAIFQKKALTIKPYANLITNVGVVGTHSTYEDSNHHVGYGITNGTWKNTPVNINTHEDKQLCLSLNKQNYIKHKIIDTLISLNLYSFSRKIYQKLHLRR